MAKKNFLLFIPIIIVLLYFNTTVKYDCIFENLVTTDYRDAKIFEEKFINAIAYFSSSDDWNNFANVNGFEDDSNVKNIMIYQINSHSIGSDLIKSFD